MAFHADYNTADNLHPPAVVSESDPGAIGAGKAWFKESTGELKIRNAADSGWVTAGAGTYTDENAQDAVGGILADDGDIDFTYDDATPKITATIKTGAVGSDELAATAVTPGSYTNADITVDADGRITAAASGTGGSGGSGEPNLYYAVPGSPNAQDDEFNDDTNQSGPINGLDAQWTWEQQGSSTLTFEKDRLIMNCALGDAKRCLLQSAPSTPYTIGCALTYYGVNNGSHKLGLVMRESGTGKLHLFDYTPTASGDIAATRFSGSGAGTFVGFDIGGGSSTVGIPRHIWLWMTDDGTDIKCYYSPDGGCPILFGTYGRTSYMAGGPNQIGIYVDEVLGSATLKVAFHHFRVTATSSP